MISIKNNWIIFLKMITNPSFVFVVIFHARLIKAIPRVVNKWIEGIRESNYLYERNLENFE